MHVFKKVLFFKQNRNRRASMMEVQIHTPWKHEEGYYLVHTPGLCLEREALSGLKKRKYREGIRLE